MGMEKKEKTVAEYLRKNPETFLKKRKRRWGALKIMVLGFMGIILLGALILMLPICNADGQWLNFVDALFTSCTCVCVTGLVTVVPAVQFTFLGKLVLLALIQIGGWGIIVCGMLFLLVLRRKISLNSRVLIHDYFSTDTVSGMVRMLIYVVKGTLIVESVGAVCLALHFIPEYGFLRGIWYGVFHAVSAFCNAGVDLLGDSSLAAYVGNPWINFVIMGLIITGGLGFWVWKDITKFLKNLEKPFYKKRGTGKIPAGNGASHQDRDYYDGIFDFGGRFVLCSSGVEQSGNSGRAVFTGEGNGCSVPVSDHQNGRLFYHLSVCTAGGIQVCVLRTDVCGRISGKHRRGNEDGYHCSGSAYLLVHPSGT